MSAPDIIVIGAGIAGISLAAELSRQARVTVLEAEPHPGTHATGRSAAIFIRNYGNATLRALNAAAAPALEHPMDGPSLLSARGELLIADEAALSTLDAYARDAEGLERLSASEAQALVPILRADGIAGAVYEPDAQDIDVDRMLAGYLRQLRAQGGQVITGARVEALSRAKGIWQVRTATGSHDAPLIVNAAGAWAAQIGALAGAAAIPLTPMRRSAAVLPAPGGHDVTRWPLFGTVTETWYARPMGGKLMVSPAEEDPVPPQDAWADDMVLAEGLDRYARQVTCEVTRVEHSWAGLRTFAADRSPVVGFDAQAEGFFWLAGQGGYGVQTAPALARLGADMILGTASALAADLGAALSPHRF